MKHSKKLSLLTAAAFLLLLTVAVSCKKSTPAQPTIVGTPGNPRFNLQFDNQANVDLDLHVITPEGNEIYYLNPSADGGQLDVDCNCAGCSLGPSENVYWTPGTAPHGTYKYFVVYYGNCGTAGAASNYTLRLLENSTILKTYTGVLNTVNQTSQVYTLSF